MGESFSLADCIGSDRSLPQLPWSALASATPANEAKDALKAQPCIIQQRRSLPQGSAQARIQPALTQPLRGRAGLGAPAASESSGRQNPAWD